LFVGADRLAERVRGRLQAVADLRQLACREVDSLLLDLRALLLLVGALLLGVSALAEQPQLIRHLLDGAREVGQLAGDDRRVFFHDGPVILGRWKRDG
jgi:hypothetical protein